MTFAFPHPTEKDGAGWNLPVGEPGMTLRDYFAGQIIGHIASQPSLLAVLRNGGDDIPAGIAKMAYGLADAMLEAREKGQP